MEIAKPRPEEYRALVEQAPIMIWRAGLDMGCDYFNERWLAFTGRTMAQEYGNGWAEGVHPEDLARCLQIYTSHFADRRPFEMEYRLRRHDQQWRWIFDRGVPLYGEAGEFLGFTGSCIDVTERVEAQELLRMSHEAALRTLGGLLPICAYCRRIKDEAGKWDVMEAYISRRSTATFTHGLCEDCARKHFP